MQYLVTGFDGPGFKSPEEYQQIVQHGIIPFFKSLKTLMGDKKILAGGLPVGDRSVVFILEAASHDEADQILRELPAWGVFQWKVTPLQSFEARERKDLKALEEIKKTHH